MKCVISSGTIFSATRRPFHAVLYGLNETRPSQDKDDEQEVFYTTALARDQADGYVLTGHPVMLQGGEYVMFTYEGLRPACRSLS